MIRGSAHRAAAVVVIASVMNLAFASRVLAVPGQPVSTSFAATGSLQSFSIPNSSFVRHVSVTLVGGSGADGGGDDMTDPGLGGFGAVVSSPVVPVAQGDTLKVAVGLAGGGPAGSSGGSAGTNGAALGAGGAGGAAANSGTGGGGGGAATMLLSSSLSPLVVAAGGGGGGGAVISASGSCDTEVGSDGASGSPNRDPLGDVGIGSNEADPGEGATGSAGGGGGDAAASPGTAAGGGAGAAGSGSGGGGGGGGYYGGGGGGRGGTFRVSASTCTGAGAGGGSGSGFGPPGTSYNTAPNTGDGSATITYIDPAITTVSVAAQPNPAVQGQAATVSSSVAPSGGSEPPPSAGTVQFAVDGKPSGPAVAVTSGTASTSLPPLAPGDHQVTASYSGADGYQNSSSAPASLTVASAGTPTVAVTTPAAGASYAQGQVANAAYTCTAVTGTQITACAGPVAPGATFDTTTLGPHTFTVTATDSLGTSNSRTVSYTVTASGAITTPPVGPNPPPTSVPVPVPTVTALSLNARCVRAIALLSSPTTAGGPLTVSYTLNEPAGVLYAVLHSTKSRRFNRCPVARGTTPETFHTVGALNGPGMSGPNSDTIARAARIGPGWPHLGRHKSVEAGRHHIALTALTHGLLPGTYVLMLQATNAAGAHSADEFVKFWVLAGRNH